MEHLPEDLKGTVEYYLSLLTPDNQTIMLARLVLAVATQEEGEQI